MSKEEEIRNKNALNQYNQKFRNLLKKKALLGVKDPMLTETFGPYGGITQTFPRVYFITRFVSSVDTDNQEIETSDGQVFKFNELASVGALS